MNKIYLLAVFAIAMGALEAIVVVYLRQLYYPLGFNFPLGFLSPQMLSVEWLREAATIVMLFYIGMIAGENPLQRFAYFLYTFAIWDIFYYAWLKVLLNWPSSFLTWDILFLIPVPWIGPVLAPIICSLTMILFSGMIIHFQKRGYVFKIKPVEWGLIVAGVIIILGTFMWDYSKIIIDDGLLSRFWILTKDQQLLKNILNYHPTTYNWMAFLLGEILMLGAIILIFRRIKSNK
ncbi:MAG TPA: hypothetical protein DCL77_19200 [Prolixibacteraceae bacterium]|jgi:hypothetical protein|nr:hypothetical protein [Prolixibacteraceae bacterium]